MRHWLIFLSTLLLVLFFQFETIITAQESKLMVMTAEFDCTHWQHPRGHGKWICQHIVVQHPRGDVWPCTHISYTYTPPTAYAVPVTVYKHAYDEKPCTHRHMKHLWDYTRPCTHYLRGRSGHPNKHKVTLVISKNKALTKKLKKSLENGVDFVVIAKTLNFSLDSNLTSEAQKGFMKLMLSFGLDRKSNWDNYLGSIKGRYDIIKSSSKSYILISRGQNKNHRV